MAPAGVAVAAGVGSAGVEAAGGGGVEGGVSAGAAVGVAVGAGVGAVLPLEWALPPERRRVWASLTAQQAREAVLAYTKEEPPQRPE